MFDPSRNRNHIYNGGTVTMGESNSGNRVWVRQDAIDAVVKTPRPTPRRLSSGSVFGGASVMLQNSDSESCDATSTCHSSSNNIHGRHLTWGWKAGYLLETNGSVVVRLDERLLQEESNNTNNGNISNTIRLKPTALQDGQVVLANEYATDEDGMIRPPHDLITLTHLNEPAVVESLHHRYVCDHIYTNTGAVLLALNPFQNVRGMYGETIMKRYWDRAERCLETEPPPHVYAIADNSFRSMMRGLEDNLLSADSTGSIYKCNQSILVSGESGSGKTVTTKFVMKYLAALSQRSLQLQQTEKRAYLKVQEQQEQQNPARLVPPSPKRISPSKTRTFQQPTWSIGGSVSKATNKTWRGSNSRPPPSRQGSSSFGSVSSTNDLMSMTLLSGSAANSIEAQVLHSNPILESFGNARTVRNDNSSRFGKFIEIQFTKTGKLVGACIDTYLLEKVRLVSNSAGERNYHIFYELLSGAMDARELNQYYLARTAGPDDFRITATGTADRRDGVTDRETYLQLRTAMNTMKFSPAETRQVFSVAAAILHASNLTFEELPSEKSCLDGSNIHLQPVCLLLGVTPADLNQALCYFSIQAGRDNLVQRALTREQAGNGLLALLKATYGALFSYLVKRINDSITYKEPAPSREDESDGHGGDEESVFSISKNIRAQKQTHSTDNESGFPVASIGVLDIFGFESFKTNSFEQLCINYCNEALQQQFNAFVLRNEQQEYESEGIEWSFIEFPENQDVLDLIDKRGAGILSILDDQCRAPGPSDKAFALDVYKKCECQPRFCASRKQQAVLKFSVHHYAGPVEYVSDGFTEKNRDELPKESTELLRNSENPFVRQLAAIIENSHQVEAVDSRAGGKSKKTLVKLHRADSSVGRATVGGQFRTQLRHLRTKIDLTSPHYVRCLKPNDFLVPDHFDTAVVAEQLRCGGILEAVRVARAGFTQHYLHSDFVRRYRALAWRELSKKETVRKNQVSSTTPAGNRRSSYPATTKTSNNRRWNGYSGTRSNTPTRGFRNTYLQNISQNGTGKTHPTRLVETKTKAEITAQCRDLVRVLYRKMMQQQEKDEGVGVGSSASATTTASSPSKARPFSPVPSPATNSPGPTTASSWSTSKTPQKWNSPVRPPYLHSVSSISIPRCGNSAGSAMERKQETASRRGRYSTGGSPWEKRPETPTPKDALPASPSWRRGRPTSTSDYARVGIQMGKTKVFLRHQAFESLERLRSVEQARAATVLNTVFRMYLARMAYLPYRDAFRRGLAEHRKMFEQDSSDDFKETKEPDYQDSFLHDGNASGKDSPHRFRSSWSTPGDSQHFNPFNFPRADFSLVDKWMVSQIRDAIHNPVPRHEWGKQAPTKGQNFKWVLMDGIWVKNFR